MYVVQFANHFQVSVHEPDYFQFSFLNLSDCQCFNDGWHVGHLKCKKFILRN